MCSYLRITVNPGLHVQWMDQENLMMVEWDDMTEGVNEKSPPAQESLPLKKFMETFSKSQPYPTETI